MFGLFAFTNIHHHKVMFTWDIFLHNQHYSFYVIGIPHIKYETKELQHFKCIWKELPTEEINKLDEYLFIINIIHHHKVILVSDIFLKNIWFECYVTPNWPIKYYTEEFHNLWSVWKVLTQWWNQQIWFALFIIANIHHHDVMLISGIFLYN